MKVIPSLNFCLVTLIEAKKEELLRSRPQASKHLISWMVSNCGTHSERENFVEELQQFIDVDIYGECGPLKVRSGHKLIKSLGFTVLCDINENKRIKVL